MPDLVTEDLLVLDQPTETYYCPLIAIQDNSGKPYLRVFADCDAYDIEVRIPYAKLEEWGWRKSS